MLQIHLTSCLTNGKLQVVAEDKNIQIDPNSGGDVSNDVLEETDNYRSDPPGNPDPTHESPAALSTPKSSLKTPEIIRDTINMKDQAKKPKPDSSSGSYYGSNDGHSDRFTKTAPSQAPRNPDRLASKPKVRMGGQTLSGAQDLEDRLQRELRQSRKMSEREVAENSARASRFRVARRHAYPVEHVLEVYNDPSTDLYDVLGVKHTIAPSELSKVYRSRAREVHPGPHHNNLSSAFLSPV